MDVTEDMYLDVEDENIVYHYCGADSFRNIIKSGKIRLTRSDFLNDKTERLLVDAWVNREWTRLCEAMKDKYAQADMEAIRHSYIIHKNLPTFITSFSEDDDSLPQWGLYGEKGRGFAIGWRREQLTAVATRFIEESVGESANYGVLGFGSVEYHARESDCDQQIFEMMRSLLEMGARCNGAMGNKMLGMLAHSLANRFKHGSFSAEKEWRYHYRPGNDVKEGLVDPMDHRTGSDGAIIPFFAICMPPPSSVMIGALNPMTVDQVSSFLGHIYGKFDWNAVRKSEAPLRFL